MRLVETSTTAAQPIGQCHRCGGTLYALLVHHCSTGRSWPETKQELLLLQSHVREVKVTYAPDPLPPTPQPSHGLRGVRAP